MARDAATNENIENGTETLLRLAARAMGNAYAPYSNHRVGAAIRADGRVFVGANIENASYGLTVCAERAAAFAAILAGATRFEAIAVSCLDAPDGAAPGQMMPCGACRQVLAEFAGPETPVLVDRVGSMTLADLLPRPFRLP